MLAIIALNALFAVIVVGGIVGLLGRSILASRTDVPAAPSRPRPSHATTRRRRLAPVTG